MSDQPTPIPVKENTGSTMSADKEELPPDERLRRMEGELQAIKMLCTQILQKVTTVAGKG